MNIYDTPVRRLLDRIESRFHGPCYAQRIFGFAVDQTSAAVVPSVPAILAAMVAHLPDADGAAREATDAARLAQPGPVRTVAVARARLLWAMVAVVLPRRLP